MLFKQQQSAWCSVLLRPRTSEDPDPLHCYWHKYVIADWGGKDFTAILFAHYNYQTKKVVIEDQLNLTGSKISSARIAQEIKDKTFELWPDPMTEGLVLKALQRTLKTTTKSYKRSKI